MSTHIHWMKTAALRALADDQINACARNYYLTYAKQLEAGVVTRLGDTQAGPCRLQPWGQGPHPQ